MKMPLHQPYSVRSASDRGVPFRASDGIRPQSCKPWEWVGCAAAIAACTAATGGVGLVACLATAAPQCIKCVD
jgi:hypothetical protein